MAGKRVQSKSHIWLKLAGSVTMLVAASLILMPLTGTADAGNVSPAQDEPEEIVPWGSRLPSVAAADIYLREDYFAFEHPTRVPLSVPVEDTYFDDAVFLGDSRTEGFKLYSGLNAGTYLHATGATVDTVITKAVWKTPAGKVPLLDALAELQFGKVYVMLGVNELGWTRTELFHQRYANVVERIRQDHPDAEIVLQSILPVSAKQEARGTYVNNRRIREYNQIIETLATEQKCRFLNVAEAVTDESGCLPEELTFDGVHLNRAGCRIWLDYLRNHPL